MALSDVSDLISERGFNRELDEYTDIDFQSEGYYQNEIIQSKGERQRKSQIKWMLAEILQLLVSIVGSYFKTECSLPKLQEWTFQLSLFISAIIIVRLLNIRFLTKHKEAQKIGSYNLGIQYLVQMGYILCCLHILCTMNFVNDCRKKAKFVYYGIIYNFIYALCLVLRYFIFIIIYPFSRNTANSHIVEYVEGLLLLEYDHPMLTKVSKDCFICAISYRPNDQITPLPCNPTHFFHKYCLINWLEEKNICPLCKTPITLKSKLERNREKSREEIEELKEEYLKALSEVNTYLQVPLTSPKVRTNSSSMFTMAVEESTPGLVLERYISTISTHGNI